MTETKKPETFPVLISREIRDNRFFNDQPRTVPFGFVEAHRRQIEANHGRRLEQLLAGGGLDWIELYAAAIGCDSYDKRVTSMTPIAVCDALAKLLIAWRAAQPRLADTAEQREGRAAIDKPMTDAPCLFGEKPAETVLPRRMLGAPKGLDIHRSGAMYERRDEVMTGSTPNRVIFSICGMDREGMSRILEKHGAGIAAAITKAMRGRFGAL